MPTCRAGLMTAGLGILLVAHLAPAVPAAAQQTGEECVLFCQSIWPCTEGQHSAGSSDIPNAMYSAGSHHGCEDGTCADKHPGCGPDFTGNEMASLTPLLNELERVIDAEDGPAMTRVLASLGGRAVLNEGRTAVQLRSCDGQVVGHFALPEALLADARNVGSWFGAASAEEAAASP